MRQTFGPARDARGPRLLSLSVIRTLRKRGEPAVSLTIRKANLNDLGIIHDIRRDAILGIESDELGITKRQAWADSRSPEFYAQRVAAGDVVLAVSASSG